MSKFGLVDDDTIDVSIRSESLSDKLSSFPAVRPKAPIDIAAFDAAAASHGFVSRESMPPAIPAVSVNRRRRAVPTEPTRHLAIRLVESQFGRFLAYADRHKLTYHAALEKLLDDVGE